MNKKEQLSTLALSTIALRQDESRVDEDAAMRHLDNDVRIYDVSKTSRAILHPDAAQDCSGKWVIFWMLEHDGIFTPHITVENAERSLRQRAGVEYLWCVYGPMEGPAIKNEEEWVLAHAQVETTMTTIETLQMNLRFAEAEHLSLYETARYEADGAWMAGRDREVFAQYQPQLDELDELIKSYRVVLRDLKRASK